MNVSTLDLALPLVRRPVLERLASLHALTAPASVAVIGASNDPRRIGGRPLAYYRQAGFKGRVIPVNSRRDEVQGLPTVARVELVDGTIDLAIIALPQDQVLTELHACIRKGARAAVIFSAGFAEAGDDGAQAQAVLGQVAQDHGVALLGPNCLGVVNGRIGHTATFGSFLEIAPARAGPIAVVSQSGAFGSYLYTALARRELTPGFWMTTGNEADVTIADAVACAAAEADTRVIAVCAEAIRDGARLCDAITIAREAGKAVAVLATGRSAVGREAAASHTAALTSDVRLAETLLQDAGAVIVERPEDLLLFAESTAKGRPMRGNALAVVSISGGAGVMMADAAEAAGLLLEPLPADVQARITSENPFATARNPVDISAQAFNQPELVARAIEVVVSSDLVDGLALFLMNWPDLPVIGPVILESLARISRETTKPITVASLVSDETRRAIKAMDFLNFEDPMRAVQALSFMRQLEPAIPPPAAPFSARPLLVPPVRTEPQAKAVLRGLGIPVPEEMEVVGVEEAGAAAAALGQPVALKIVASNLPHKTDAGGVRLDLIGGDTVREAAAEMLRSVRAAAPAADVEGFLVTRMVASGADFIVGVRHHPSFGPIIVVGAGGVLAELLDDVAVARCPVDHSEALKLIARLRAAALLDGIRGEPPLDRSGLADALVRLSQFAVSAQDFEAFEINPLRVASDGVWALDANAVQAADRPPYWCFSDFLPGAPMGETEWAITVEIADDFYKAVGETPATSMSPGLLVAEMMRAYIAVVTPRPEGNVHVAQELDIAALPPLGATLRFAVRCVDKGVRRGSRRVTFEVIVSGEEGVVGSGRFSFNWAR